MQGFEIKKRSEPLLVHFFSVLKYVCGKSVLK